MAEKVRADQPARFSVAMVAPAAAHVSGQIFGSTGENIILYSQPRPIETVTKEKMLLSDEKRKLEKDQAKVQGDLKALTTRVQAPDEAVPKMAPKFFDLNRGPLPGAQNTQQKQPA